MQTIDPPTQGEYANVYCHLALINLFFAVITTCIHTQLRKPLCRTQALKEKIIEQHKPGESIERSSLNTNTLRILP